MTFLTEKELQIWWLRIFTASLEKCRDFERAAWDADRAISQIPDISFSEDGARVIRRGKP